MSFSIPDSISFKALKEFAQQAGESHEEPLYDGLTESEVKELAMETLRGMTRKCKDPMVEKCIMLAIAMSWVRWHTEMAQQIMPEVQSSDDEAPANFATCLLRVAGKALAIYTRARDISMENHLILSHNED